jgi:hypothetical protein
MKKVDRINSVKEQVIKRIEQRASVRRKKEKSRKVSFQLEESAKLMSGLTETHHL